MDDRKNKFWQDLDEREGLPSKQSPDEFPEPLPTDEEGWSRRSFLKAAGFSFGAVAAAGACSRSPIDKAIPYLIQPEQIVPGRAYWLASTCRGCSAGCGLLVKCREGRPIKVEGIPEHPISRGGVCAIGQATVLELYDSHRLEQPLHKGRKSDWSTVDSAISAKLAEIEASGGAIRVLSSTINSPTLQSSIDRFTSRFPDARHITYDAISSSAIRQAHRATHGDSMLPRYRFDRAEVIVSFDADFLGTWISPVEYTAGYSAGRRPTGTPPRMSHHVQFEGRMSLTGGRADRRFRLAPSEIPATVAHLIDQVGKVSGSSVDLGALPDTPVDSRTLRDLATRLWNARGHALVVSGTQDVATQILVNRLNGMLDSYGSTIDPDQRSHQKASDDEALHVLLDELKRGDVLALFIVRANPLYDLSFQELETALAGVPLVVSLSPEHDETSKLAHYVCPEPHFLESWEDVEAIDGIASVIQPSFRSLRSTRSPIESFLNWSGESLPAYDAIQSHWKDQIFARRTASEISFQHFWDRTLSEGYVELASSESPARVAAAFEPLPIPAPGDDPWELVLYPTVALGDGSHATNPWLQELPDPITKVTWDNYVSMSPAAARSLGVVEGDIVRVDVANSRGPALELPVYVQPGQADRVVGIPLGYGRAGTERFGSYGPQWLFRRQWQNDGEPVGRNAFPLLMADGGLLRLERSGVRLTRTEERRALPTTQKHHRLTSPENLARLAPGERPIVQATTLEAFAKDPHAGAPSSHHPKEGLWAKHEYPGHRWGMAIDLNACTGCSGCVIACQAENNVPVVGRDEVLREREMHWIRIDCYYSGDDDDIQVAHQPMMCHHCDNASCESVCPVLATVHSDEGLNQQVYNRCVGTRYCANNCPFKVRRFNWFNYPREDRLQNMSLNPDVTVRSRGVMEKCSFCAQRIESARIDARRDGRQIADGEIKPACAQSCPSNAIVFGDMNDPKSEISRMREDPRHYLVLEELNLETSVGYLRPVRNAEQEAEEIKHV